MIIVSQEKDEILNFNNIMNIQVTNCEEDEDYPDGRIINNKEKAVQRILDRITDKRFNQIEIWKVIQVKSWDTTDNTYRPICNRLRELGYEIIN